MSRRERAQHSIAPVALSQHTLRGPLSPPLFTAAALFYAGAASVFSYFAAIAAVATGLMQKQSFLRDATPKAPLFGTANVLANATALLAVFTSLGVSAARESETHCHLSLFGWIHACMYLDYIYGYVYVGFVTCNGLWACLRPQVLGSLGFGRVGASRSAAASESAAGPEGPGAPAASYSSAGGLRTRTLSSNAR